MRLKITVLFFCNFEFSHFLSYTAHKSTWKAVIFVYVNPKENQDKGNAFTNGMSDHSGTN